ncbi:MAG TPA: XdhC family protein [Pseudonocardiaceae bacterium]|jgi:xanthine/CO dehydrogenase XdhC/CoxF family maturation factor|nr:XdhC family protein [Pseudonocardiaceae bacterium]
MATPERTPTADAVAHGAPSPPTVRGTLIAVFASPVAACLLRYGVDLGYRPVLLDPDPDRTLAGFTVVTSIDAAAPDEDTDVVVTDHHREELGVMLRDALAVRTRWIGLMGNPRHVGPHHEALAALDVPAAEIARVHRPIGLNIGSRRPPEIAIATLAGLLADRNDRPGGFF